MNHENVFSLEERLSNLSFDDLAKSLPIKNDDLSIEHDGRRLHITVTKVVEVPSDKPLPIFTTEEVLLEPDDRTYILSCRWPTHNLNTNVSLGAGMEDWEIINATVGPQKYHPKAETLGNITFSEKRDSVNIWVPNWVLPGLAVVVEWRPKM